MKTQLAFQKESIGLTKSISVSKTSMRGTIKSALSLFSIFVMTLLISNAAYAQTEKATATNQITVKGMVSDDEGPLPGVNITLKNAQVGTTTDKNGAFTFPKALAIGDVLIFSYLGYETQEIRIRKNTSFIKLMLTTDLVEILGAVNDDKPYKSKRKN